MARYEDLSVDLLRVNKIQWMNRAGASAPVGSTNGFIIASGNSTTPIVDSTPAGSAIKVYVSPTGTTGRYTGIWVNTTLGTFTSATQGAGAYAIRGETGVSASKTFTMSSNQGYLAGVQGKLSVAGTTVGNMYMTAGFFQMQTGASAVFSAGSALYGLWVDNQAGGAAGPSNSYMVNITNNGGTITSFLYFYGNNATTYFAQFGACAGAISASGAGGGTSKYLKCLIDGVAYSILIKSDA